MQMCASSSQFLSILLLGLFCGRHAMETAGVIHLRSREPETGANIVVDLKSETRGCGNRGRPVGDGQTGGWFFHQTVRPGHFRQGNDGMSMNEMNCCCGTYGCRQGADLAGNARSFSDHGNLRCIIQAACLQELDVDVITSLFSNRHERVSWAVDAFVERSEE